MTSIPPSGRLVAAILRTIPPLLPGKARLARFLLEPWRDLSDVLVTNRYGDRFLVPSLREPMAFNLLADGIYESATLNFILRNLQSGSTYVDIGANIGSLVIPAARRVGDTGLAVAVEASPRIYSYLETNLQLNNLCNIHAVHGAAQDVDQSSCRFFDAPISHFGMGSLAPQFDSSAIEVPGYTVDSLLANLSIEKVDVLKMDVEGFEFSVLQGASRLLRSGSPPTIVFEFSDWAEARLGSGMIGATQRLLQSLGFNLQVLHINGDLRPMPFGSVMTVGSAMFVASRNRGVRSVP